MSRALLLSLMLASAGCVSRALGPDLDEVRRLTSRAAAQVPAQPTAHEEGSSDEVRALLERPLSVELAVRVALLNSRALRAELLALGVARGQLLQASLFPNPEVEVALRAPVGQSAGVEWDLGVGVDLRGILLRSQERAVAQAGLDEARLRAAASVLDLGYRVRVAVYDAQAAQQRVELAQTMQASYAAGREVTEALHAAGSATPLERASAEAAHEQARIQTAEAEAELIDARERLNALLGLSGRETTWQLASSLPDPSRSLGELAHLESRAVEASLDLGALRAALTASERRVALSRTAGWLPELHLGARAESNGTDWSLGPALTGRLPLTDRQTGRVLEREARRDALSQALVATAVEVRAATRAARARALSTEARVRHFRSGVLPLRARVVEEAQRAYNAMQLGVFQLLQARREQLEAGRAYIATLRDYWGARAALEQLLAGRLVVPPRAMASGQAPSTTSTAPHPASDGAIGH